MTASAALFTDIENEMFAAAGRVAQPHLDRMEELGAAPGIRALGEWCPPFGIATGAGEDSGFFLPGEGAPHVVQPVIEAGEMVDLVFWQTQKPEVWWLRTGAAWALNPDELVWHGWYPQRTHLLNSPLDWLRAGAQGSVILDWSAAEVRQLLNHDRLTCASDKVATMLERTLRNFVRFPEIQAGELQYAA